MTKNELTLDFLNKEMTKARRQGKVLTDIVLGKQEMEIIRDWTYTVFPTKSPTYDENTISLPESVRDKIFTKAAPEIWGVTLHQINKDSYFETFNLGIDNYNPLPPGEDEVLDFQVIEDEKRMKELIKNNQ